MANVAWIGLGVMGAPMAGHLSSRGLHSVTAFNRTPSKAESWRAAGNNRSTAPTPYEAADGADFVFCCAGNDSDVRSITTGESGAFRAMKPGAIFIDHTTTSAELARDLASQAQKLDIFYIDCPVSGGEAGAKAGTLTVMAGGDESACRRAEPVVACFAKQFTRMGASGSGQLAKMCNQIAVAGVVQGLAEAIHFAECAGLDIAALMATITKGAAQSWQMENRWQTMHARQFDFGFAVDWMRKDLGICLDEAARNGAELPATAVIDGFYAGLQKSGAGRFDTSSLILRLGSRSKTS